MDKGTDFEQERRRLTAWAWWVTGGYGALLLLLSLMVISGEQGINQFRVMDPNEVGDLLAGIAGPIAFIWLVYGYFLQGIAIRQQAKELAQNTQALKLQEEALRAQVEELKRSVEQQIDLVRVSKDQAEVGIKALQFEMRRDSKSARPIFVLEVSRVSPFTSAAAVLASAPGVKKRPQYLVEAKLRNQGNIATEICPVAENFEGTIYPPKIQAMSNLEECTMNFLVEPEGGEIFRINIRYRDKNDDSGEQKFELMTSFTSDGKLHWLNSSRLD